MWDLGGTFNDRWTFVKLYPQNTISEPQMEIESATFWWPVRRSNPWATKTQVAALRCNNIINKYCFPLRSYISRTCTLPYHLYLGSSVARASHRTSEGCVFNLRLGLRNRFSEERAWRKKIYHSKSSNLPCTKTVSYEAIWYWGGKINCLLRYIYLLRWPDG